MAFFKVWRSHVLQTTVCYESLDFPWLHENLIFLVGVGRHEFMVEEARLIEVFLSNHYWNFHTCRSS